jgi:hypothetical protein
MRLPAAKTQKKLTRSIPHCFIWKNKIQDEKKSFIYPFVSCTKTEKK